MGVIDSFPYLCAAFNAYKDPGEDLETAFKNILQSYKQSSGDNWQSYFAAFPEELKRGLQDRFSV